MVVLTTVPSSWMVIGSSTISSSGRRRTSSPVDTVVTSSDLTAATGSHGQQGTRGIARLGTAGNMVRPMETQNNGRILAAELVGTAVLMLGGPGVAIFRFEHVSASLGVAARLRLLVDDHGLLHRADLRLPHQPGGHPRHAAWPARSTPLTPCYAWVGQVIGAIGGCAIIYGIASRSRRVPTAASSPPTCGAASTSAWARRSSSRSSSRRCW